jgi:murein DD-endopeptidase MepM/ murein hydrolase activator NlpD
MIGTSRGVSSPIVNGGPLNSAGNGHQIIVDIPQDFNSTLVYYCTNHTTMSQSMNVASPSGGFVPVYNLNASQLTSLVNASNIVAGNYKVVEEMNASNQLELRIRPVVQTNGSWVDFGANLFYRTNSSYPTLSSVLNYITSNNINAVNAPTVDTISITSPTSGSTVLENNDNLHVYINYQSNGGGYQTPTWAYRIDSGFPGYGSPHGGTQVTGTSTKSNFLSGQSYGSKTVHVALLDQSGNLHNPPITLNRTLNYQSSGGGYSSPGGGYSSPGSGYSSPGSGYSSSSSGYSSPPIYETTATLLVNNQPTSIAGIPPAGSGSTWYQSFTAENSAKLTKFAFATNGSFSATADVKIREGEGITGNILHSGTWSGLGSNTNNFNEYEITNEVLLTSGQKYTIQLENQTSGGFIGSNPGQYNGGMFYYSGYSGEYGDLKMKIWGLLEATGNAIEIISPAYDDQNITDSNDTLTISYNYQSNAGGYQTPTWAYRIDSGFPGYGSPHGGTQVTGSRINNNFLNGQTYGNKTVYVALLDPAGNLHNPPVTQSISVNYQTPTSGYQSSTGGTIAISSPGNSADVNATNDNLQVTVTYTSPSGGYQTPTWAYRIDSGFPGYGSPHGGTQVTGNQANDFLAGESFGARLVNVALLDSAGNLHNPPITQSISVNYQTPTSGYQSDSGNYQSSGGDYQSSGSGWSINPATYQNSMTMTALVSIDGSSKGSGSLAAFAGSQIRGLQSNLSFPTFGPHQGQGLFQIMIYGEIDSTPLQFKWSTDGTETNAISVSRQDGISISFENNGNQGSVISPVSLLGTSQPNNSYQSDSGNYQSSGGDYQSDSDGYQSPDSDYQDPTGEQAEENTPFTVTASKLTNGQITFTSNAPVDSLYSVEIQLTNLSNLSPSKEGKLIFNLDGKGSTTLMTLDQVEEDGGWGYNWSYWWNYGYSGESQNFNYAYRIPYTSEEKFMVGQGYMGTWSHQDTYAIDWSMPEGTTLYAARAGKVIMVKEDSNEGGSEKSFIDKANYVTIGHLDGSKADYLHLQQNGALVKVGDIVKIGDPIGLSGNTGWSTEPHLHFQVFHQTDPRNSTTVATSFLDKDGNIISMQEGNSYYGSGDLIESTPNIIAPLPNIEDQAPITDDQSLGGTDEPTAVLPVFVTTIGFQSNVNEVILSGEILHKSESDYTNIKVGFLISPSAEIMEIDPLTYKVSGFFESAGLFSANYTPSSNGVLYFKAFAENESGVSYGNIRKISNNEISNTQNQTPTEKAISILQVDSIEVSGGWKQNSWFGLYKDYSNGWVYHNELGWLYLSADTTNGIWAWSEERSWVWSSKEVYPFLYQSNVGDWIYFLTSNDGQLYFYNYFTDSVEVNSP